MSSPPFENLKDAYPETLRLSEEAKIHERRRHSQIPLESPNVGIALSGGGIRSATFCLGLFQALAAQKLIRRIDLLSTVSGGGYFGSFLGAAYSRKHANVDSVEKELADNHSWSIQWLRQNGRFLSPNGAGDSWVGVGVVVRNWIAMHVVLLTFGFLLLAIGEIFRWDLWTMDSTKKYWWTLENYLWSHWAFGLWWSPWIVVPLIPLVCIVVPTGSLYWLTQFSPLMGLMRRMFGLFSKCYRKIDDREFASRAQTSLTYGFVFGLILVVATTLFGAVDSLGQTVYERWSRQHFEFPSLWALLTGAGMGAYGFASQIFMLIEKMLGRRKLKLTFNIAALGLSISWLLLIVIGLSVTACGFAWNWDVVWDDTQFLPMVGGLQLTVAFACAFGLSWWFSRCFSFVNLSSMQQIYAARIRRAYIGATNPYRREQQNFSMSDLLPGDDLSLEQYQPYRHGGPLHFVNVTVNETLSGKTQIERVDRKGLAMAVGPSGLSVGVTGHALWADRPKPTRRFSLPVLWENRTRPIIPIDTHEGCPFNPLQVNQRPNKEGEIPADLQKIEALSFGRWIAVSGAAFSTGLGAGTQLGLSLLLGLANVRLGYWWDSGVDPSQRKCTTRPTFVELAGRVLSRVLPVQSCLMNELFARFHGPARQHWYLSDGGHFENTACYELIRRRVPFIICSDGGQDSGYQFPDLANLVRKARTDFGAEIEIIRHASESGKEEPASRHPLPRIEDFVHPSVRDIIGSPEDFAALNDDSGVDASKGTGRAPMSNRHALLARIRYLDTNEICWLLIIKPSLMGDEAIDVIQYQRTHPLFPQEPTSDQYFDEAQWESYRKLGEHIGNSIFTQPASPEEGWSPSSFLAPNFSKPAKKQPNAEEVGAPQLVSPRTAERMTN